MSDCATVASSLSDGQLNLIVRNYGIGSKRSLADVGCGEGAWHRKRHARGLQVSGLEEKGRTSGPADNVIAHGNPAAAVPWGSQTLDCILLRSPSILNQKEFSPELMIALANLASSLKKRGRLLIPVSSSESEDVSHWQRHLQIFPGTVRVRSLQSGWRAIVTLAFLFGRSYRVDLIEFRVPRKHPSRLEWHRMAREAVLSRMNPPAAA